MLFFSGAVLVAVAGLALSQDKSPRKHPGQAQRLAEAQRPLPSASAKAAADFPVVGYIEKRDRTITIKAGPKGPVYSVKTADRQGPVREPVSGSSAQRRPSG